MKAMFQVAGVVAAPPEVVAALLFGPPGEPARGQLVRDVLHGLPGAHLTGGPARFDVVRGDAHLLYVDLDPACQVLGIQGHWWYRGEYAVEPHADGCVLRHRVYNAATWLRWCVPLANRFFVGFRTGMVAGFQRTLIQVGVNLDRPVTLLDESRGSV